MREFEIDALQHRFNAGTLTDTDIHHLFVVLRIQARELASSRRFTDIWTQAYKAAGPEFDRMISTQSGTRPESLGSGYRPTAWCKECHASYLAELSTCPECARAQIEAAEAGVRG